MGERAPDIEAEIGPPIGAAILRAREDKGWRQYDLADASGIGQGTISRWERGLLVPSIAELILLERVMDLSAGSLFAAAGVVPANGDTVHAIKADRDLEEPERDFVLKAYFAARMVSRSEREVAPDAPPRRRGQHRRR